MTYHLWGYYKQFLKIKIFIICCDLDNIEWMCVSMIYLIIISMNFVTYKSLPTI